MSFQLAVKISDAVEKALKNIGRTEDIKFSPDNNKLAIAGFHKNKILVIDIVIEESAGTKLVILTDCLTLTSSGLNAPHGLCFFDNNTIGVANRYGEVMIFKLSELDINERVCKTSPIQTLGSNHKHRIKTPGSLIATKIGLDLYELLVCNNYSHKVTRHILDAREDYRSLKNEILLSKELNVPDGIATNKSNLWIAISNHNTHNALLFKNDLSIGPQSEPSGKLNNVKYPHGICFTNDDKFILLADAGTTDVHIYAKNGADWDGNHDPIVSISVMDNTTYVRGSYNPQEGGPKGIDVTADMKIFVTTCHQQTLAFFDLEKILEEYTSYRNATPKNFSINDNAKIIERSRHALIRELLNPDEKIIKQIEEAESQHFKQIESIYRSYSWKITAPLRVADSKLKSLKYRWSKIKIEKGWI